MIDDAECNCCNVLDSLRLLALEVRAACKVLHCLSCLTVLMLVKFSDLGTTS